MGLGGMFNSVIDRVDDIAPCFTRRGVWKYTLPGCLSLWKASDLSLDLCLYTERLTFGERVCYKKSQTINAPLGGRISSLVLRPLCSVTLFQGPNKTGKSLKVTDLEEVLWTLPPDFEQRLGSLSLECSPV